MSLYALQVTTSDITALQQGILFTTTSATDINNQVLAINGGTQTVASYANQLLGSVLNTSQMAMGVTALETNSSQSVATLTNLVANPEIIPSYENFAQAQGLNVGLVVAENIGLVFSGDPNFDAAYGSLSLSAFSAKAAAVTGINSAFLTAQAQFFINLYSANGLPNNPTPTPTQITDAAYGVAFGLGVGLAIEGTGTQASTIQGQVKNALFDIAQTSSSPPGQMYVPGATLAAQPVPTPFQSGGPPPPSNPLSIADIIPISQSFFDIFRNSEPSIAVNPMNPMQMVAAAFGAANSGNGAPFFFSTNGGTTWSLFGTLNHGDTSLAWSLDGSKVLATTLTSTGDPDSGSTINTFSSTVANMNFGNAINTFPPAGSARGLDQPWIETGPANHVYVGYNQAPSPTVPGATASILVSSDGGNTYGAPITLDQAPQLRDDPSVREAVNGNTVYAVFDRWTNQLSNNADGTQFASQLVVERSDNAGADSFKALGVNGIGVVVDTPTVPFAGPAVGTPAASNTALTFGQNRSDIGTAIAVNPSNPNDVVVAYSSVTNYVPGQTGVIKVFVQESTNGGMSWTQKYMSPDGIRSGDSSVAILANGAIGVLYDSYDPTTNKLVTHLVTTTNDFMTAPTDMTLATQTNPPGTDPNQPYLGDYLNIVGVGNTFYGIFSALNADNGTSALIDPSNPASVIFQRSSIGTPGSSNFQVTDANGTPGSVAPSIDPFFFKFTPPTGAPLVGVAQTHLDHVLV